MIVDITFLFTICIRIFSMEHSVIKAMADFVYLDDSFNFFNQGSKHWLVRTPCSENLIQGWTGSGARIPALNLIEIALFSHWFVGQWFISHNKNNFQNSSFMSFIFCDFSNFLLIRKTDLPFDFYDSFQNLQRLTWDDSSSPCFLQSPLSIIAYTFWSIDKLEWFSATEPISTLFVKAIKPN